MHILPPAATHTICTWLCTCLPYLAGGPVPIGQSFPWLGLGVLAGWAVGIGKDETCGLYCLPAAVLGDPQQGEHCPWRKLARHGLDVVRVQDFERLNGPSMADGLHGTAPVYGVLRRPRLGEK